MSNKKYEHWCDKMHQNPEDKEENKKYIIGELAHNNYTILEQYLLHDIGKDMSIVFADTTQEKISKDYVIQRMYRMLDIAEDIELLVYDANSCYALYDTDYKYRRDRWLESKGLCYKLIRQLTHLSSIMVKGANIHKYVSLSKEYEKLANKIKNVMCSDDERKKKHGKKYNG